MMPPGDQINDLLSAFPGFGGVHMFEVIGEIKGDQVPVGASGVEGVELRSLNEDHTHGIIRSDLMDLTVIGQSKNTVTVGGITPDNLLRRQSAVRVGGMGVEIRLERNPFFAEIVHGFFLSISLSR